MKPWQFRQKTIGFGIAREFYLTVLAGTARLPAPVAVANPKGQGGALEGFLVPLTKGAEKEDLGKPITRGTYVLSSLDRKTVLRMLVMSKEDVGFDPSLIRESEYADILSPEHLARISATWNLIQLSFEAHHPEVHPSLQFLLRAARLFAQDTEGVVADPVSQTYRLPAELIHGDGPITDARDVIKVWGRGDGLHTLGGRKFGFPELEISGVGSEGADAAGALMLGIHQSMLKGEKFVLGGLVGSRLAPLQIALHGADPRWGEIECWDLIPAAGKTMEACLSAWKSESGQA